MRWLAVVLMLVSVSATAQRLRDYGVEIGILPTGKMNALVDVPGVTVGHTTLIAGESIRTGVTAIVPHQGNLFQEKMPAAIYVHNGFGKLAGISQVTELGNIETPIILTNTLSVPTAMEAVITYTLSLPGNENVRSVNAVVGETNDGSLNDIRGRHVTERHVLEAIASASHSNVAEGNVGAGTGTRAFGYKGGIGTSSRVLPDALGGYTIGVLVQANFGGVLEVAGVPVGKLMDNYPFRSALEKSDGSCMMVVLTDAPLSARNLERLAKRAAMGLAKTGGIASNGSGDYVIAVSTNDQVRIPYVMDTREVSAPTLHNDAMSALFLAAIEATEESILNALFAAETMTGNGITVASLPKSEVIQLLKKYLRID